jgi:hypothetical protein
MRPGRITPFGDDHRHARRRHTHDVLDLTAGDDHVVVLQRLIGCQHASLDRERRVRSHAGGARPNLPRRQAVVRRIGVKPVSHDGRPVGEVEECRRHRVLRASAGGRATGS